MAQINLLPWRQELRKEQQRQFLSVLGLMVVFGAAVVFAVYLNYGRMIGVQESRNQYLKDHIAVVDKQIAEIKELQNKKNNLLARMNVIQQLQRNRPEIVRLFDDMVRVIPDGIHLESLKQNNKNLSMSGVAQSNARVSAFMRNIESSNWMTNPKLEVIKSTKEHGSRNFSLQATQQTGTDENNKGTGK